MQLPRQSGSRAASSSVGIALAAVGLVVVLLGWNGVAGQRTVLGQLPYLISGGLLGLALVVLGAAMLVVQGAREDRARLEAKLDEVVDALAHGAGLGGGPSPVDASGLVVAGTASYHVPGCRLVDGREETRYLTPEEAVAAELKACRVCRPEAAAAGPDVRIR